MQCKREGKFHCLPATESPFPCKSSTRHDVPANCPPVPVLSTLQACPCPNVSSPNESAQVRKRQRRERNGRQCRHKQVLSPPVSGAVESASHSPHQNACSPGVVCNVSLMWDGDRKGQRHYCVRVSPSSSALPSQEMPAAMRCSRLAMSLSLVQFVLPVS